MVSQEQTYLSTLEKQASDNPEEALKKIQSLVKEYPYFQALYHMGWQIAKTHGLGDTSSLLHACSLRTKNRLHLIPNPDYVEQPKLTKYTTGDANEVKSFSDWLVQLAPTSNAASDESRLIDKFLSDVPKISFEKTAEKQVDLTKKQSFDAQTLMTETLAEVYVKQGKLKKAKKAYEILALKYPEKSSFFATQIKKIKSKLKES
jgi:predicted Zn-dependent protease